MDKNTNNRWGIFSSSLYVSFQLFANVLSTKIVLLPFVNLAVDGGTIIYPLTFTLRDFVHKTCGKKLSRQVVILAGGLNFVMFILFWLVGMLPSDPSWPYQEAYNNILLPVTRIVIGSVVAQVISELIDTELFSIFYKKTSDMLAVFISNSIALVFDSFIFVAIAFYGNLPNQTLWQIILVNIIIKFVVTIISVPSIKLIPRRVGVEEI